MIKSSVTLGWSICWTLNIPSWESLFLTTDKSITLDGAQRFSPLTAEQLESPLEILNPVPGPNPRGCDSTNKLIVTFETSQVVLTLSQCYSCPLPQWILIPIVGSIVLPQLPTALLGSFYHQFFMLMFYFWCLAIFLSVAIIFFHCAECCVGSSWTRNSFLEIHSSFWEFSFVLKKYSVFLSSGILTSWTLGHLDWSSGYILILPLLLLLTLYFVLLKLL